MKRNLWPVPFEHQLTMWVDLAMKNGRHSGPLEAEVESSDTGEERSKSHKFEEVTQVSVSVVAAILRERL